TVVRNLIAQHGGNVQAMSEGIGKGSQFMIRLPAAEMDDARLAPDGNMIDEALAAPVRTRVLIVDDNEDAAELLAEALRMKGHDTRPAFDPLSALEIAPRFVPDVILLDIGLPTMDGYQLSAKLQQMQELRATRLFALTGYSQASDRRRSRNLGFEQHLAKP